ncbi:MAG: LysM peptidoglycan-binding domain-containing protein [Anaerolineales bacterium]|nr:LysM peptidoglycan-binding domain-containing protein [Anaerolineales bacterium]
MVNHVTESYTNDPLFQEAMKSLQSDNWEKGLAFLEELHNRFPEDIELFNLVKEFKLRARIDQDEQEDQKILAKKNIKKWGIRSLILLIVLGIGIVAYWQYANKMAFQVKQLRTNLIEQVHSLEAASMFRDAQALLQANRAIDALEIIQKIEEKYPAYPGLADLKLKAQDLQELEILYQQATSFFDEGEYILALQAFQKINDKDPSFKDVSSRIEEINGKVLLEDIILKANLAYDNHDWEIALSEYESLHAISPNYQIDFVEERLIDCYINMAKRVLHNNPDSYEALNKADEYFQKALVIHPLDARILREKENAMASYKERLTWFYVQKGRDILIEEEDSLDAFNKAREYFNLALSISPENQEVQIEQEMAEAFLNAQRNFEADTLDEAISNLEFIYNNNMEYAHGIARQMLFDAYMRRGELFEAGGEYEYALTDYQRAAQIANDDPEGIARLYWAKFKIGYTLGILGDYEQADQLFADAINVTGLYELAQKADPNVVVLINEAERYYDLEWYRTSYRLYKRVLPASDILFLVVDYEVKEGDYLSQLASRYGTTAQAILAANKLLSPRSIRSGQVIKIPKIEKETGK